MADVREKGKTDWFLPMAWVVLTSLGAGIGAMWGLSGAVVGALAGAVAFPVLFVALFAVALAAAPGGGTRSDGRRW